LEAGASQEATDKARAMVESFERFIEDNRDEIDALRFFYSVPHAERLQFRDVKALAEAIKAPPRQWTPEALWRAYEALDRDRVRGASSQRLLTDVVSLVRYALHRDDELVPYSDVVRERFASWMTGQANRGRTFTEEQMRWLEMMRDHVATSLEIDLEDFDFDPFAQQGGRGKARKVFGAELGAILHELNEVLVA
jgi:type I restriction enzyme R subunit